MIIKILVAIFIILIFVCIIGYVSYIYMFAKIDKNMRLKLYLNSRWMNRGRQNCPNGCVQKKCLYKNFCFNCKGNDPECCCNDEQCSKC